MDGGFTPEQVNAIEQGVNYLDNFEFNRKEVFRIFGYAGTGKTTLAQEIAKRSKLRIQFMAYTGKAALVLASKGCVNAATIHKTIFVPRGTAVKEYKDQLDTWEAMEAGPEKDTLGRKLETSKQSLNSPIFIPKDLSEFPRDMAFACDEVSMVDKFIGESMLRYGFPVIVLGDPAQLKPIAGEGFFTNAKPDVLLRHIHRQAAGNPVLRLATAIRPKDMDGGGRALTLPYGSLGDSRIVKSLRPAEYAEYEQILCGKNATRIAVNHAFRKMLKRTKVLEEGEKLICLQNNYEVGVMNGGMWKVLRAEFVERGPHKYYRCDLQSLDMRGERLTGVMVHVMPFLEGTTHHMKFWTPMLTGNPEGLVMTYGSAITVHKSQGSQWKNGVLIDEWSRSDHQYPNWLYTGVTRFAERITIVRKEQAG
jgi:ATP-dependent exoDNAse (exonuclease V) alpha subunit